MCQKTKLCRFYARGMCTRGTACAFAHGDDELQPEPDLSRTKPCPVLLNTGVCEDPDCTFAHEQGEIRRFPLVGGESLGQGLTRAASSMQRQIRTAEKEEPPKTGANAAWMPYYQHPPPPPSMMLPMSLPMLLPETTELLTSAMTFANEDAVEQLETSSRAPRNKFAKTKMCTLFLNGHCKKRGKCNFAHSEEEMRPLPNLSKTKLCPKLLNSEICVDSDCPFAHSPEELRQWHSANGVENSENAVATLAEDEVNDEEKGKDHELQALDEGDDLNQEGWDSPDEFLSQSDDFSRQASGELGLDSAWKRQQTEDPVALAVREMRVKNTFITVIEEEEEQGDEKRRKRRARSAPATMSTHKPKSALLVAETFDGCAEDEPFNTLEEPSTESPGEDQGMMYLQFGHEAIFPSPRRSFQVADSCDPALSSPSMVSSSLDQTLPAQSLALFKDCPLRIDSGLNEWRPFAQKIPDPARDPLSLGEPHFVQPSVDQRTPQTKLAWPESFPRSWPENFPLDYGMNQRLLMKDWRQGG